MKKWMALMLAAAMLFALAACGGGGNAAEPKEDTQAEAQSAEGASAAAEPAVEADTGGKTSIIVGNINSIEGFDMANSNNGTGMELVYEALFSLNPDTGEVENQLADSYEFVDDCTLKITLKDGITFSNGETLRASDFLWSWNRLREKGSNMAERVAWINLEESYTEGDNVLVIKSDEPYGPAITALSTIYLAPLCQAYEESSPDESHLWDAPVGTGPYRVKEIAAGSHVTYELRDDYWGAQYGRTYDVDEITVKYYAEPATMFIDFETHALDMAFQLNASDAERIINNGEGDDYTFVSQSGNDVYYLGFCEYVEAFQDIRVREALCHAVDVDQVASAAVGSLFISATSTLGSSLNYYVNVGGYDYDPDLARQLLDDAGYSDGLSLRIVMMTNPVTQNIAEAVQYYFNQVGVDLIIESYDLPTAVPMFMAGDCDMIVKNVFGGADLLEPNQVYESVMATTTNTSARLSDPTLNEYWNAALHSVDPEVRAENYKLAQEYIHDNYLVLPCFETVDCFVFWNNYSVNVSNVVQPDLRFVHVN